MKDEDRHRSYDFRIREWFTDEQQQEMLNAQMRAYQEQMMRYRAGFRTHYTYVNPLQLQKFQWKKEYDFGTNPDTMIVDEYEESPKPSKEAKFWSNVRKLYWYRVQKNGGLPL